jgi:hypothetical protein
VQAVEVAYDGDGFPEHLFCCVGGVEIGCFGFRFLLRLSHSSRFINHYLAGRFAMMPPLPGIFLALAAVLPALACAAPLPAMTAQELDAWFNGKSTAEVNEGELRFLTAPPLKPVHHHQNRIRITADSLASGWTELEQCHDNLDAVPRAQITFREGYIRNLRVLESRAIDEAWVEGPTVQLREVHPGARLCLAAQTRALKDSGGGYYTLHSGPYMRKFLDGYYPMQVSLELEYPAQLLQIIDISPGEQAGFHVSEKAGQLNIDTLFEGELRTQVQFERLH